MVWERRDKQRHNTMVLPFRRFPVERVQFPKVSCGLSEVESVSVVSQYVSLTLGQNACITHLTSTQHLCSLSSHIITRWVSTVRP